MQQNVFDDKIMSQDQNETKKWYNKNWENQWNPKEAR